jgi:uncharacterized cupredoxin-like copper-binding protein
VTRPHPRVAGGAVALAAVLALLVGGCGAGVNDDTAAPAASASSMPAAASIRVGLSEWTIALSAGRVRAGTVTMKVTNAGATMHNLVVKGALGKWHTPDLQPGQHATLRVHTKPGERLQMWCAVPGHRAQGMYAVLNVAK